MDAVFAGPLPKSLNGIETLFTDGSPFMSETMTCGDLFLAAFFRFAVDLQPGVLDNFPKCKALHTHVENLPGIRQWNKEHPAVYFKRE